MITCPVLLIYLIWYVTTGFVTAVECYWFVMLFLLAQVFISVVVINKELVLLLTCYSSYLSKGQCSFFVIVLFVVDYYLSSFPNTMLVIGYYKCVLVGLLHSYKMYITLAVAGLNALFVCDLTSSHFFLIRHLVHVSNVLITWNNKDIKTQMLLVLIFLFTT